MSYKKLCMAAKNEEQSQTELRKWQDYSRSHKSFPTKGKYDKSTKDKSHKPTQHSRIPTGSRETLSGGGTHTAIYVVN